MHLAEVAILAGTVINVRRMVPVVALASVPPTSVVAARVRLKAITAQTSQAAFAGELAGPQVREGSSSDRHGPVR